MSARDEAAGGVELLPCPFCGGEASSFPNLALMDAFVVECDECKADTGYCETEAKAVAAWNTRAPSPRDQAAGGDLPALLRKTTQQMAVGCSVDMTLWGAHSNACLQAADEIERFRARDQASSAMLGALDGLMKELGMSGGRPSMAAQNKAREAVQLARSAGIEPGEGGQ